MLKIVYMTLQIALHTKKINDSDMEIIAVLTQPDRPAGEDENKEAHQKIC